MSEKHDNMMSLLNESFREVINRWREVFKIFWPTAVLLPVAFLFFYLLVNPNQTYTEQNSAGDSWAYLITGILLLIGILWGCGLGPAAVIWHRAVILKEPVTSNPKFPSRKSWTYIGKLLLITLPYFFYSGFMKVAWEDLIAPLLFGGTYWFHSGTFDFYRFVDKMNSSNEEFLVLFVAPTAGKLLVCFTYVLMVSRWYLALPETCLNPEQRGARLTWPPQGYREFTLAVFSVTGLPIIIENLVEYVQGYLKAYWEYDAYLLPVIIIFISVFCSLWGLTLLSIAYKRNLDYLTAKTS
jgi:hypothetical protein